MNLFVYGTLMFPEVWRRVAGGEHRRQPATLHDYAAFRVRGEPYPVLAPAPGATVSGVVVYGVEDDAMTRLDAYEGDLYVRIEVEVALTPAGAAPAERLNCQAYSLSSARREAKTDELWDVEQFRDQWLAEYLKRLAD